MTLEQNILQKLKANKGELLRYSDLHHYWFDDLSDNQKKNLVKLIHTKISKIRKENPLMNIESVSRQGYVYKGDFDRDKLKCLINKIEGDIKVMRLSIPITLDDAKYILKLLKTK